MLLVLCGTNRPGAHSRTVAKLAHEKLTAAAGSKYPVGYLDLADLKQDIFDPANYGTKPGWFDEQFQKPILEARGVLLVTPEYNGSFPGVLKYFIDMLRFPESFNRMPVALVGVAMGQFGALRAVEQLELILNYRKAHIFGERLFVPGIDEVLEKSPRLGELEPRLDSLIAGFASFACAIPPRSAQK